MDVTKAELSDREIQQLSDTLLKDFIKCHFASGDITDDDLKDKLVLTKKVRKLLDAKRFQFVIDHRNSIVQQANIFFNAHNFQFAKIFYATFFEHTINSIIDAVCRRKNLGPKTSTEIIKNINLIRKFSWLLKLLDLEQFSRTHLNTILSLVEQRNSFVHYKWNNHKEFEREEDERVKEELAFHKKVKSAVAYMKRYESIILYKKSLTKLKKASEL